MVPSLTELDQMIGMKSIKHAIFEKIILCLQGLENTNKDYQHIVLCGSPGMGKTAVAKIIGRLYAKMGFLSKGEFKEATLTDFKGGYVGQSEIKTQKLLENAKGCVLFLDEAYSLGSEDKIDSYSQSIIDLINPFLDKYKNDFILIVAGYKADLHSRFFRGNQGLLSRFGLGLEIEPYSGADLQNIFLKKIHDYEWFISDEAEIVKFFNTHSDTFKYYGRDIEMLFAKCKIAHAKRVLFSNPDEKKHITYLDIVEGYTIFKQQSGEISKDSINKSILEAMYV